MKCSYFILLCFFVSVSSKAQISNIVLEGNYQGKNIYIQNPLANNGQGYCSEKVLVNGKEIPFTKSSAFEIKLDSLGFKIGDSVKIQIFHKDDCKPKVLNTDGGNPKITFDIVSISLDKNALLSWTSINEIGKLPFVIEQFRWNKWVKIGEVDGKGGSGENQYAFQTIPHSGKNQFRVKQNYSSSIKISKSVEFYGPDLEIKIISNQYKIADELEFNKETMYELYDQNGNIIRRGMGKKISFKGLERRTYYLNYDNKMTEVIKFW